MCELCEHSFCARCVRRYAFIDVTFGGWRRIYVLEVASVCGSVTRKDVPVYALKAYEARGGGGIDPLILNLGTLCPS